MGDMEDEDLIPPIDVGNDFLKNPFGSYASKILSGIKKDNRAILSGYGDKIRFVFEIARLLKYVEDLEIEKIKRVSEENKEGVKIYFRIIEEKDTPATKRAIDLAREGNNGES